MLKAPKTTKSWWRRLRFSLWRPLHRILHLEDTPHRIALGSAAGIVSAWLPTLGQTFAGMLLAKLARGSVLASLPWSWISNPFTTLPMWWMCYLVGVRLTPGFEMVDRAELERVVTAFENLGFWQALAQGAGLIGGIWLPAFVGSLILGGISGGLVYLPLRAGVARVQRRRAERVAAEYGGAGGRS